MPGIKRMSRGKEVTDSSSERVALASYAISIRIEY